MPGDWMRPLLDTAARRAAIEIGAVGMSMVKQSLMQDRDIRGFIGRKDTGLAHNLVNALPPERTPRGWRVVVGIGPPRDAISGVLEKGRRAGRRMPPVDAIEAWVRRKLRDRVALTLPGAKVSSMAKATIAVKTRTADEKVKRGTWTKAERNAYVRSLGVGKVTGVKRAALDRAIRARAWVIARSIGRRGFPGLSMFAKAKAALGKGRAASIMRSAVHRTLREWRGGGRAR